MPPLTLLIKPVSSACSMRCEYCFYADVSEQREQYNLGKMDLETLELLVKRAFAYAEGSVTFAFQGGEPTLAGLGFYQQLIVFERKYNTRHIRVGNAIQTNGYRVPRELLEFLAQEDFLIGVSLDGSPRLHDRCRKTPDGGASSAEVEKTLRILTELKASFNILTVVNEYVAENARECLDAFSAYRYLQFIPCLDSFDGTKADYSLTAKSYGEFLKESFDRYYWAFRQGRPISIRNFDNYLGILLGQEPENCGMCGRCGTYFLIEGDGSVYPCDFYVLDKWKLGNIREQNFFRLAKSPLGDEFRKMSHPLPEGCRECKWLPLCRGGCRRDREPFTETVPSRNQWCESYKAFFEYAYPRMQELASKVRRS